MSQPPRTYNIQPLEKADIPTLMAISEAAFTNDAHTRMKMYEKGTTDPRSELEPLDSIERQFDNPNMKMLKAVDGDKMVGFSNWQMWNFDKDITGVEDVPVSLGSEVVNLDFPVLPTQTPLEQLQAITNGHMYGMISRLNRPDNRTFFCVGISVHPEYQGRGVASALLEWVTGFADEHEAQCWVHLSDHPGGVRAFEKSGFEVVNSVTVDLDDYAVRGGGGGGGWGEYTFRFMLRLPQK